jgi:ketosteroid isomerase-like protein
MTREEQLVHRYFDAFNRHDVEGVMECFHASPRIIDPEGHTFEGRADVRRHYESGFALLPDGQCDLKTCTGNDGHALAESVFHGTRPRDGRSVKAIGAEVIEVVEGRIKEIRDYHRPLVAEAA